MPRATLSRACKGVLKEESRRYYVETYFSRGQRWQGFSEFATYRYVHIEGEEGTLKPSVEKYKHFLAFLVR